jgi:hypothetical protein
MQKVITTPVDLGLAVLSRAKATRRRRIFPPLSPPLEILTLNISTDSDFDEGNCYPSTQQEQALMTNGMPCMCSRPLKRILFRTNQNPICTSAATMTVLAAAVNLWTARTVTTRKEMNRSNCRPLTGSASPRTNRMVPCGRRNVAVANSGAYIPLNPWSPPRLS